MRIDLSDPQAFDRHNLHPLPDGQMAVRPGLRSIHTPDSGREFCGGGTVRAPSTGELWHYLVDAKSSGAAPDVRIVVLDETFDPVQTLTVGSNAIPRAVTVSAGVGEVLVSSPDFPTHHAWMGGAIGLAQPVDSVDPGETALSVPWGLAVAWAGRHVIASEGVLYFSDALAARTYVPSNALAGEWEGEIYGLAVSAEGALVVGAGSGIFALSEQAAAAGQTVIGDWSRLTDVGIYAHHTMCSARGNVYALTEKGLRQAFPPGPELPLSQKALTRYHGPRVFLPDFREGRLYGAQAGPVAGARNAIHVLDAATGHRAWWTAPNATTFELRGFLQDHHGEDLLITSEAVYRTIGNFDGEEALTSEDAAEVIGVFAGPIETPPDQNIVLRETRMASDTSGDIHMAACGSNKTSTPTQRGIVIGTDSWDDGNTYARPTVEPRRRKWSKRTRDLEVEVGAERPLSRVSTAMTLEVAGLGRRRPS